MNPEREREDWIGQGNCSLDGVDPGIFFIGQGKSAAPARAVCGRDTGHACPVIEECLDYALRCEPDGIWAGYTESQRRRIVKERRAR